MAVVCLVTLLSQPGYQDGLDPAASLNGPSARTPAEDVGGKS